MSTATLELAPLVKHTVDDGVQSWKIRVEPLDDGTAMIITTYGRIDGKQQEAREHIKEGKNLGKKNATTALQQAYQEAEAKHLKQLERNCYGFTVEQSKAARLAAPMLAQPYAKHASKVDWSHDCFAQRKIDGFRMLALCTEDGVFLRSRSGIFFDLPHLIEQYKWMMLPGQVFDGELYAHGLSLNQISSLANRPRAESEQLSHWLYDMKLNLKPGEAGVPFGVRIQILQKLVSASQHAPIKVLDTDPVHSEDELMRIQAEHIAEGFEGSMLRHGQADYESGKRSDSLLKVKTFQDAEFTVTGVKEGKGTYLGMAIFQCITPAGHEFEVTAPGSHDEKRQYWQNSEKYLGQSLTVKYSQLTNTETPVPFHPVAIAFKQLKAKKPTAV